MRDLKLQAQVWGTRRDVPSQRNLRAHIAELRKRGMEHTVLLPKRPLRPPDMRRGHLVLHICVRYLRDRRDIEHKRQDKHEYRDRQVHPLHILQTRD